MVRGVFQDKEQLFCHSHENRRNHCSEEEESRIHVYGHDDCPERGRSPWKQKDEKAYNKLLDVEYESCQSNPAVQAVHVGDFLDIVVLKHSHHGDDGEDGSHSV